MTDSADKLSEWKLLISLTFYSQGSPAFKNSSRVQCLRSVLEILLLSNEHCFFFFSGEKEEVLSQNYVSWLIVSSLLSCTNYAFPALLQNWWKMFCLRGKGMAKTTANTFDYSNRRGCKTAKVHFLLSYYIVDTGKTCSLIFFPKMQAPHLCCKEQVFRISFVFPWDTNWICPLEAASRD